jgi:hypothetical protein
MKSADIEVGQTYLYEPSSYGARRIVRVLQVLTQAERREMLTAAAAAKGKIRRFDRAIDTVEMVVLATVTSDQVVLADQTDVLWNRPATLTRPYTVDQARADIQAAVDRVADSERKAHATVARYSEALAGTGLPLPEVARPGYRASFWSVSWPKWDDEDYDRLVELLGTRR